MWVAPDDTWCLSPMKVGSIDPGPRGKILDINIHLTRFSTTPEILQNTISRFSRSGIHKTEIQAEIEQIIQELEFTNQDYRERYSKILLKKSQEVEFIKQTYRQR